MEDKRNILKEEEPFDYKLLKDDKAQIFYNNKMIKVIHGKDYIKLTNKINSDDEYTLQLFLAKITGHFKHSNKTNGRG